MGSAREQLALAWLRCQTVILGRVEERSRNLVILRTVVNGVSRCLVMLAGWTVGLALFAAGLVYVGIQPEGMPVELFFWPQSSLLGGSGYPPAEPLVTAELLGHCPAGRPATRGRPGQADDGSVRAPPRWVLQDMPCLNASHLDAGVCVAAAGPKGARPATMRCLPSFLVIGAQKAGSTDLRGLLSFHPYLDGPSSEVRGGGGGGRE